MDERVLAYPAGIVDGEAYIGIKNGNLRHASPSYAPRIQVRMVEEAAIRLLYETFGGGYHLGPPHSARGRPLYCWALSNRKAVAAFETLLPYLRVKRRQAEVAIAMGHMRSRSYLYRSRVVGYRNFPNAHGTPRQVPNLALSYEYLEQAEDLYLLCKKLNKVGIQ